MIDVASVFYFVFGFLTLVGGVIGFLKAKSRASLIAGGICGLALIAAGALVAWDRINYGLILGLLVSVALAGQFVPKTVMGRAPIHSILMAVLSTVSLVITLITLTKK